MPWKPIFDRVEKDPNSQATTVYFTLKHTDVTREPVSRNIKLFPGTVLTMADFKALVLEVKTSYDRQDAVTAAIETFKFGDEIK